MDSCDNHCPPCKIPVVVTGEDKTLNVKVVNQSNQLPLDISTASQITASFLNADGSTLEKTLTDSGIAIISGPGGAFAIMLAAADTALLATNVQGIVISLVIAAKTTIINLPNSVDVQSPLFTP